MGACAVKISINVDMTPEELRRFLGLPDVTPLNDDLVEKMRERVSGGVEGFDPTSVVGPMMATNVAAYEAMQRAFWNALAQGGKDADDAGERAGSADRSDER